MDKESIKGAGQKIKGKIEEVVGKISVTRSLSSMENPTSSKATLHGFSRPREGM